MLRRFLVIGSLLAASLAFASPSFARLPASDDEFTSRQTISRDHAPINLWADASTTAPSTATATPAIASTPTSSVDWLGGMIAAVLAPCLIWLITKIGGWFGMNSKSAAFAALVKLADSALDKGALKAILVDKLNDAHEKWHDTVVVHAYDEIWEVGSPFIAKLGWDESAVKKFLSNELAPAT